MPAPRALLLALTGLLAGCVQAPADMGSTGPLAPATPIDSRSHGTFEQMSGINGDAVSAISGDASRNYLYFDLFAANKAAVEAAPARLCASYGTGLKSSYITEPANREPGLKVLVVDCQA